MDQGSLVEMQIEDGAKVVEKLRDGGFDVTAAWWMKASEGGEWFLYIASALVDEVGIAASYRKAHALIRDLGQLWVDRFEVKLVGPGSPVTRDVLEVLNRSRGRLATRYGGKKLGDVSIEGAYLYPPPVPAAPTPAKP
ncbi:MAG: hypothetical protein ACRC33_08505 [Gemmataceae bacterium]